MKKLISSVVCLMLVLTMVLPSFGIAVVKVTGIQLDKTSVSLGVGETKVLAITFAPANTTQKVLTFTTSNKNVASVNTDGTIIATGAGSADITVISASDSTVKAVCKVTVKAKAKVTLTVEVFDRGNVGGTPADNNIYTTWIQDNFQKANPNIQLKFITAPRWQEVNKLNVWMASNQAPDLCLTYDVNSVFNYYKNGGLTKLDTALNAFGPQLKEFLGKDVLDRGKYYGELWSIPAKRVMNAKEATWIRKDWLDTLKMPIPTTTMEYYDTMKAFKEKNPGKVGKVTPMAVTQDIAWTANFLLESFITDKTKYSRMLSADNLRFLAPGYKDGVRFLNKMYNEGLLSTEFSLDRDGVFVKADFSKGYVGSLTNNYDIPLRSSDLPTFIPEMKKKIPGFEFIPIDPFKDKDGITTKLVYDQAGVRILVPKTSEKKVNEAITYLNWMADKDVLFHLQYGEEGVNYTMKNGLPVYQVATGEKVMNSPNNIDYTIIVNGIQAGSDELNLKINSLAYGGVEDLFIEAVKLSTKNSYVQPVGSVPNDADAKYSNTLKEKGYEIYAKLLTCKPAEFDATWDKMINELLKVGGSEVLEARKAAYKQEFGGSRE